MCAASTQGFSHHKHRRVCPCKVTFRMGSDQCAEEWGTRRGPLQVVLLERDALPLPGVVSLVCESQEGPAGSKEGLEQPRGSGCLLTKKETLLFDNQFCPVQWCAGTGLSQCLRTACYLFRNFVSWFLNIAVVTH